MPRRARIDSPGTLHHVIVRGIERRRIVNTDTDREDFVARMHLVATETTTAIYAWALMTNHAHLLLRSRPRGLAYAMRRILSGYATAYNLRHRRSGHLFQNRYTSIVCEEDAYFMELVRYIHLNPLRARIVGNFSELDHYPYCGHSVIMGRRQLTGQHREFVLSWFGPTELTALHFYRRFVEQGISNDMQAYSHRQWT